VQELIGNILHSQYDRCRRLLNKRM